MAALKPCLLCGCVDIDATAFFIPNRESGNRFSVPAGKTRLYFYGLCDTCLDRPDRDEAVETEILAHRRRRA
jgi:hypothetical protein